MRLRRGTSLSSWKENSQKGTTMSEQYEKNWDNLLNIKTSGRDDSLANTYNYPYEPTPYKVLERLANSGYIRKKELLVDYGCGKGRVEFFLAYQVKAQVVGIEYDENMYNKALENLSNISNNGYVSFTLKNAVDYAFPVEAKHAYFFNPFSVELLKQVMVNIQNSFYDAPREIYLYFYYPSDEYISYLMSVDELEFEDEINCRDIFHKQDERERIMIFKFCVY